MDLVWYGMFGLDWLGLVWFELDIILSAVMWWVSHKFWDEVNEKKDLGRES